MPRNDGTGPQGLGPKTGRAMGNCADQPIHESNNPTPRYGPRFGARRGWRRGGWRGVGKGWGRGQRQSWWFPPIAYAQSPKQETAALEYYKKELVAERTALEQEEKQVEARIQELKTKRTKTQDGNSTSELNKLAYPGKSDGQT